MPKKWYKLICRSRDLQLSGTLNGGQSFRWEHNPESNEWTGVFDKKVWILKQEENELLYQVFEKEEHDEPATKKLKTNKEDHYKDLLKNYFRLDININDYYTEWCDRDSNFKVASQQFYGVRILNQDVTENIFSFICSSNNNIKRISSMVNKLARFYGKRICKIEGVEFYSFPDVKALAQEGVDQNLRINGFGYRAKYIHSSAKIILNQGGNEWLEKLKAMSYLDAKKNLMTLQGVGAKVADCICLMSLGHLEAIPVDTHIYQIAARLYLPHIAKQKTVTEKIYNEIGDHFRKLYGPLAGWAHTVLFCADLRKFRLDDESQSNKKENK